MFTITIIFSIDLMMGSISRYSVVSSENDYGTGSLTSNGTWSGAIGRIIKRV